MTASPIPGDRSRAGTQAVGSRASAGLRRRRARVSMRLSMRWWLALAFAFVAVLTAVAVAAVYRDRSEQGLLERSRDLAVGRTVTLAAQVGREVTAGRPVAAVVTARSARSGIALFAFDERGALLTPPTSARLQLSAVPGRSEAVAAVLAGERYVAVAGGRTIVALRVRAGPARVLLASTPLRDSSAELAIAREATVVATVAAALLGIAVGVGVAVLIGVRLRRIAAAASEIADGDFTRPLTAGFPDELGALATDVDRMRERLSASFSSLESERAKLRRLLGRLHEGVLAVDADMVVRVANPAAAALLRAETLAEGTPLPDPWPAPRLRDLVRTLFEPGAGPLHERVETSDTRALELVGLPPLPGDQTAVLVIADLTAEEERARSQREFVANAAHQLRTPLTTILTAVEVLRAGADQDPEARARFLDHVEREASRLARLTRALLALARAQVREESPRSEQLRVRDLLDAVAATVRPQDGVRVEVRCPAALVAFGELDLLEQALVNVVENSARHTHEGAITLSGRRQGQQTAVEVEDTGAGMSPETSARAFDRFYRGNGRDRSGFGLGLAIVREAVEAMGGTVSIDSAPGRGTTTTILLPSAPPE